MKIFSERLRELIATNEINNEKLSKEIDVSSRTVINKWINLYQIPTLENAIKLANYFSCSLDYLFGLSESNEEFQNKNFVPFDVQLKKILKEKNISQNKLMRETKFGSGSLYSWFNQKSQPNMLTVVELAKYLNVSLDYLAGRE